MNQRFTISVFTENIVGMLHRITIIFTRRQINIESITASESEIEGIHRYTIVVSESESKVQKVTLQLEKQIEILKAFYHLDDQVVYQEMALFKIATSSSSGSQAFESIIRTHQARVLYVDAQFTVLERTGHKQDIQALFEALTPFEVLESVRSGRIAITKPMRTLTSILNELEHPTVN